MRPASTTQVTAPVTSAGTAGSPRRERDNAFRRSLAVWSRLTSLGMSGRNAGMMRVMNPAVIRFRVARLRESWVARLRDLASTRHRKDVAGLIPIGWAIGSMLALALAVGAAVTVAGFQFLHFREFKPEPELSAGTLYDLLKVAFAFAAGIGGVIALVTAYRRQRINERKGSPNLSMRSIVSRLSR